MGSVFLAYLTVISRNKRKLVDSRLTEFVTLFLQRHIEIIVNRVAKGGVHKLFNLADLRQIEIPVPNIEHILQFTRIKEIVQIMNDKLNQIDDFPIFESLTQKAFSGSL